MENAAILIFLNHLGPQNISLLTSDLQFFHKNPNLLTIRLDKGVHLPH